VKGKNTNMYATSADAIAVHRVKKGETLGRIAIIYGTTVDELCKLNGISRTSTLSIGQAIRFRAKQLSMEASPAIIKQMEQEKNQTVEIAATTQPTPVEGPVYHRIEAGETLFSVAKKYDTTIEKLCELNGIKDNIIIKIGQRIRCS
jgi:LysM repeat protein